MKRSVLAGAAFAAAVIFAPAAFADCVDYDPARAARAASALSRNPPSPASLGMPTLDGLVLDAARTAGDPVCDGPPKAFRYTTGLSTLDFVTALYPNIRRRVETDGMNRTWFKNPLSGDSLFLTSGTKVTIQTRGDNGPITLITLTPANPVLPLTPESQPYTAAEIANWTPWPGGPDGPRAFIRADGGAPSAPPATQQGAAAAPQQTQAPTCPQTAGGAAAGAQAGAQIGGSVFGGGRAGAIGSAAGAAIGGLMGRRNAPQPSQGAPNC